MEDTPNRDEVDSISDLYRPPAGEASDPLLEALAVWDHNTYRSLQQTDPELYRLICTQIGFEPDILLGSGTVKLGGGGRHIELTWNGDDEDLVDLVLESARLIGDA